MSSTTSAPAPIASPDLIQTLMNELEKTQKLFDLIESTTNESLIDTPTQPHPQTTSEKNVS